MVHPFYKMKKRISYRFRIRHHKGHGIHSPYLYRFITSVLQENNPFYCFEQIESNRKKLYSDTTSNYKRFKKLHRNKDAHNCQILFRIIQNASFKTLLEFGTFTGIETQYMCMAKPEARCVSVTKSEQLAQLAQKGFQEEGLSQIDLHLIKPDEDPATILTDFDSLDFVLFNHLSDPQEILDLFKRCLPLNNKGSIFVLMGIHKNPRMDEVWKKIRAHVEVQTSIDTYDLGILLFNPELSKKNYVLQTKYTYL